MAAIPLLPVRNIGFKSGVASSDAFAIDLADGWPVVRLHGCYLVNHEKLFTSLAFGRREEDEHFQFFRHIIEAVLDLGSHEDHAARGNFAIFFSGSEASASADQVVYFVFVMRPLQVRASGRQD